MLKPDDVGDLVQHDGTQRSIGTEIQRELHGGLAVERHRLLRLMSDPLPEPAAGLPQTKALGSAAGGRAVG